MSSTYSATFFQPSSCIDGITENQGTSVNICLSGIAQQDPWLAVTLAGQPQVSELCLHCVLTACRFALGRLCFFSVSVLHRR